MQILVLADTHMPSRAQVLPEQVRNSLPNVDAIFHLGDFTCGELADSLEKHAPLFAVHGNNDSEEVRQRFPAICRVNIQGHRFALLHGHERGRTALTAARSVDNADVVVFGHSHQGFCARENGKLLFNPGSPTDRRWNPYRTFGLLDVGTEIVPQLIRVT